MALRDAMTFSPDRAEYYAEQGWWTDDTLASWLADHAAERPDAPAIIQGDLRISYTQLTDRVDTLAWGLS